MGIALEDIIEWQMKHFVPISAGIGAATCAGVILSGNPESYLPWRIVGETVGIPAIYGLGLSVASSILEYKRAYQERSKTD